MLNYDEIVTRSEAHRNWLLTNAEQQHLTDTLAALAEALVSDLGTIVTEIRHSAEATAIEEQVAALCYR